jgi:prepilin-type processing-associated H-X9-DG protein
MRPIFSSGKENDNLTAVYGFRSQHGDGANFVFGDGTVKYLSQHMDYGVFQSLANRADGKPLGRF